MHHGLRQLDLNDKQEKAIHKIMRDSRADFRHLEEKIRDKRYELYELIDGSQDQARLNKLADEIGDLMAERIKLRVATRVKILQELTADQREEARDIPFLGR
jgi:Spy/CpxP family protein refolding chaperone